MRYSVSVSMGRSSEVSVGAGVCNDSARSSAPCLKMRDRKIKNSPVVRENEMLVSTDVELLDNKSAIETASSDIIETATDTMIEARPKRKLSLALSKVNGVPSDNTFLKYLSAQKARMASPTQDMSPAIHA